MKLLFAIFTFLALNSHSQQTYVPDDDFESYLEANSMGNGIPNDDSVTTANISGVTSLNIDGSPISDLTGIEDFTSLTSLYCSNSNLTSLDVSQNLALGYFACDNNQLTSLDVSQNAQLYYLVCSNNLLTSLDLSQNSQLGGLYCHNNLLTALDLSQNGSLTDLYCLNNPLECLNVRNGNNGPGGIDFNVTLCPLLTCIEVDDVAWSTANWTNIDPQTSFSTSCPNACLVGVEELTNTPKQLIKIVDLMGRETLYKANTPLIYMYSDGTIERVFTLD